MLCLRFPLTQTGFKSQRHFVFQTTLEVSKRTHFHENLPNLNCSGSAYSHEMIIKSWNLPSPNVPTFSWNLIGLCHLECCSTCPRFNLQHFNWIEKIPAKATQLSKGLNVCTVCRQYRFVLFKFRTHTTKVPNVEQILM